MTKRRYNEDLPDDPQKRGGSGAFGMALALMFGAAIALSADSHADPRSAYAQVTQSITNTLRSLTSDQRGVTLRIGDWPSQLLQFADVTISNLPAIDTTPAIAIVIDDLGNDVAHTNAAIALPANVTLSFLPYPKRTLELSGRAHQAGHEVIVHLPMQPMGNENPGDHALKVGLPSDELQQRLSWSLSRVSEYDGVNNHMGSRFTTSRADLLPVMRELKGRGLFFLDSRTTEKTQVEKLAREVGVLTGSRDIFIDDDRSEAAIAHQLTLIEDFARKNRNVIAIGHPYPETLAALSKWTKTIKERGFRLATLREVLQARETAAPAVVTAGVSFGPLR